MNISEIKPKKYLTYLIIFIKSKKRNNENLNELK